jgi:hypothetical protein
MPRLAVIDAAAVDGRRRLVLVRRDNVEHLLMIGGPTDIVVEPNIVRATPARDQMGARPAVAGTEPPPRVAPLPDAPNWSDDGSRSDAFDLAEPLMPEPPPRPARPSFADEARRPAPAIAERRSDPLLSGFSPEPVGARPEPRPEPVLPRAARSEPILSRPQRASEAPKPPPIRAPERAASPERAAPPPPPPPLPPSPPLSSADQNLAEMAQRLEAALRRPAGEPSGESKSEPRNEPRNEPRIGAPPVAPEPPPARAARSEPVIAPPVAAPAPKSGFENLEDEMASLLGRPKTPS